MNNNSIKCSKICVDCVINDPVDVRCGGPDYLGFDFYVRFEQTEEMQKFIKMTLETLDIPLINIYIGETRNLNEREAWTKQRIVKTIKDNASYLKSEAKRNYHSSFKR